MLNMTGTVSLVGEDSLSTVRGVEASVGESGGNPGVVVGGFGKELT